MSERTSSILFTAEHTYRLTPHARWTLRRLGTMLLGLSVFMVSIGVNMLPGRDGLLTWFVAVFFTVFPILFFAIGCMHWYNAKRMHLTFTLDTFRIQACGYTLTCAWSNVSRIGIRRGEEWLFLDQPAEVVGLLRWLPRLYQLDRFIRLNSWGQWWGSNELAQDLRQTIPHIVEETGSGHK